MKEARAEHKPYPTDLTDAQWSEIEPLYSGMRNRKWSKRKLTNTVLYIVKTGCQWRQLPHDFPPYQTVYSFFSREAKSGLWEKILTYLVGKSRKDTGKSAELHYMLIDAQSVKFFIWQTPVTWRSAIKRPSLRTRPATMDRIACSAQGLPSRAWNSKKREPITSPSWRKKAEL